MGVDLCCPRDSASLCAGLSCSGCVPRCQLLLRQAVGEVTEVGILDEDYRQLVKEIKSEDIGFST